MHAIVLSKHTCTFFAKYDDGLSCFLSHLWSKEVKRFQN